MNEPVNEKSDVQSKDRTWLFCCIGNCVKTSAADASKTMSSGVFRMRERPLAAFLKKIHKKYAKTNIVDVMGGGGDRMLEMGRRICTAPLCSFTL